MLVTTPTGHPHLYCMRTASCKHASRGCENNDIVDLNGSTSIASMTVINMPQQQCFQLQQQRQQYHENIERIKCKNSLRIPDTTLRRSNETKTLESKRRVIKMLFVLVLEFFICWTPLYVINTLAMFIGSAMYEYIGYTSISFFQLLAYSSSCCNPITYCFMNAGFRRAFLDTFRGLQWREGYFWQQKRKHEHNLSVAGNSITLANSVTVMTNNTLLDSPRL